MSKVIDKLNGAPKFKITNIIYIVLLIAALAFCMYDIGFEQIKTNPLPVINLIVKGFINPDFDFLLDTSSAGLIFLVLQTIAISFLGTIIGALIALPLSFLASYNVTNKVVSNIATGIVTFIRTIPFLVFALVFIKIVGPGAFCGVLTIAVTSIGMLSKMFIEAIEEVEAGLLESGESIGLNLWHKCRYILFPQLLSNFISTIIYRFDIKIKNSTIIGIIGAGGIGTEINNAISANNWSKFAMIMYVMIIIFLIIDYVSTKIRKRLV